MIQLKSNPNIHRIPGRIFQDTHPRFPKRFTCPLECTANKEKKKKCSSMVTTTTTTRRRKGWPLWASSAGVVEEQFGYMVGGFGWGVRRMVEDGEEMRRVAHVQAEAFHSPVGLFNDCFFQFFEAEILSALLYRIRNSAPNRYACLVAEPMNASNSIYASVQEIVGVVDVTVQREEDVLRHLEGAEEYLYVSGIAVLKNFRRQKVATILLKACDALSLLWGFNYLALRAYEDDFAACKLYKNAGYRIVSRDPLWITWIGRKRRVLMIKNSVLRDWS